MIFNQRGIRDLFRYSLACISSFSIILYIILSTFGLFFPKEDSETINDIFLRNEISDEGETILGYGGNDVEMGDIEEFGTKRISNIEEDRHQKIALNISKKVINNTDQSLQDEIVFYHEENTVEGSENSEFTGGDKFDIEKIIADLHLQKEKRVAVVAKQLGIDWKKEKLDYAKLAGIDGAYNGSLDQNQKIRNYLIANAQAIYKDKHGWNEWETLPLVTEEEKKVKMNSKEIKGQVTYNDVTVKVSAPIESFPEGTILKIKTLEDDDSTTTFDITFKEVILMTQVDNVEYDAPMASFDISFYDPDDTEFLNELQPAEGKSVSVTFDYTNNKEFKNPENEGFLAIYHMEDNDETSVANLVSTKNSAWNNTKSDYMNIYANTLSVYILTVVSDLDEEVSENNKTVTFDAGTGGFIVNNDNIVLSSTETNIDAIYTGKILSKNDNITLPDVHVASGHTFSGWYNGNIFLGKAGDIFKLGNNNSEPEEADLIIEETENFDIRACLYTEGFTGDICNLNENQGSDLNILEEALDNEDISEIEGYSPSEEEIQKYGQEMFDAYNRAINNGITTIDDIDKAKLNKKVTRAELAKMMVEFMSGTLQKEPIITEETNYKDVNSKKLGDLAGYIELAYQYQIMGIKADGTPTKKFNPNKTVTRAEFATVLSRVLYGSTYNQSGENYYEKHIEALENSNILTNTNPDLVEARGQIMTMLYNAQNSVANSNNQDSL